MRIKVGDKVEFRGGTIGRVVKNVGGTDWVVKSRGVDYAVEERRMTVVPEDPTIENEVVVDVEEPDNSDDGDEEETLKEIVDNLDDEREEKVVVEVGVDEEDGDVEVTVDGLTGPVQGGDKDLLDAVENPELKKGDLEYGMYGDEDGTHYVDVPKESDLDKAVREANEAVGNGNGDKS